MSTTTANLGLVLPANGENFDLSVWVGNMQKIDQRFPKNQLSSLSDVVDYFNTYKTGIVRITNTVCQTLAGKNRQAVVMGCQITSEYIAYILVDSNGMCFSGYITTTNLTATYKSITENDYATPTKPSGSKWTAGTISLRKRNGVVMVKIDGATLEALTARATIAVVPSGYTPITETYFTSADGSRSFLIDTSGNLKANAQSAGQVWGTGMYLASD